MEKIIELEGKKYKLVPIESELPESYEDCMRCFQGSEMCCLTSCADVETFKMAKYDTTGIIHDSLKTSVPSSKCAEQLKAAAQLFVIWWALNNGPYYPRANELFHNVVFDHKKNRLVIYDCAFSHNPFPFRTKDNKGNSINLAKHAIKIAEPIWLKYFGKC